MPSMLVFECGQKRQRLAHFQDEAGELGGALRRTRGCSQQCGRNFINKYRCIAPKMRDAE
jgi:hypothetical protein